jgi:hypothetical protein
VATHLSSGFRTGTARSRLLFTKQTDSCKFVDIKAYVTALLIESLFGAVIVSSLEVTILNFMLPNLSTVKM